MPIIAFNAAHEGAYGWLSNDYRCSFIHKGIQFSSVEQAYYYNIANCVSRYPCRDVLQFSLSRLLEMTRWTHLCQEILSTTDVRKLPVSRLKSTDQYQSWAGHNSVKETLLLELIYAKFSQDDRLRSMLLGTSHCYLASENPDPFFGVGVGLRHFEGNRRGPWPGWNRLGDILMEVVLPSTSVRLYSSVQSVDGQSQNNRVLLCSWKDARMEQVFAIAEAAVQVFTTLKGLMLFPGTAASFFRAPAIANGNSGSVYGVAKRLRTEEYQWQTGLTSSVVVPVRELINTTNDYMEQIDKVLPKHVDFGLATCNRQPLQSPTDSRLRVIDEFNEFLTSRLQNSIGMSNNYFLSCFGSSVRIEYFNADGVSLNDYGSVCLHSHVSEVFQLQPYFFAYQNF